MQNTLIDAYARAQILTRLEKLAIFLAPATHSQWRKLGYVIADDLR
jgi:hypothetical protein